MDKNHISKKSIALLVSLILVMTMAVGTTIAFLIDKTDSLKNVFTPSKVTVEVNETFDGKEKSDVSIKNTGDTTAYIRAAVVITWQNEAGEVYGKVPVKNEDFTITFADDGWVYRNSDGFYYHKNSVAAGANTGILISEVKPVANRAPEGYFLCVEILASGIQSAPIDAVKEAWGVDPSTLG